MDSRLIDENYSPLTDSRYNYQNLNIANKHSAEQLLNNFSETAKINNSLRLDDHNGRNNKFLNESDPYLLAFNAI
jgi:hypothetical protein